MPSFGYPLEDIRARCDVVEIISPYVALKKTGKSLKGLCPFHVEKTPSFVVNRDTQRWICFGCGASGDIFEFLMRMEGLTFAEAVEQLAAKAGIDISRTAKDVRSAGERDLMLRVNNLAAVYFRKSLEQSKEAKEYIRRRGIPPEAIDQFRIGFAPPEWDGLTVYLRSQGIRLDDGVKAGLLIARQQGQGYYDRFRHRLVFPIFDIQNRVIGFGGRALGESDAKYINTPETRLFVKNRTLYALNFARKAIVDQNCAILVEGYMDAVTAHSAGFVNVVATMGTALTPEHVNLLSRYTRSAVLVFDADSAGMAAAIRSAPMFEDADFEVKAAPMPEGEDPDSLIRKGNRAVFAELITSAVPIPDYRLMNIITKYDAADRAGQLAILKEAIPIVAEVNRQVERERLIALLAPYHPNFRKGTTPAEVHIRQEIDARRAKMSRGQPNAKAKVSNEKVNLLTEEGKAVRKAERELLGSILCHGLSAANIFDKLPPAEFVSEDAKIVAAAVQEESTNTGRLSVDILAARIAATQAEQLLNELLAVGAGSSSIATDDLINTIKNYHKKEQEKRFRTLAEKIQRGEIKRTDNEFAEYWQLVRELHE